MRRGRHAATAAIPQRQKPCGPGGRRIPATDRHQDANDVAHHMVQEAVGSDTELDQITATLELEVIDAAHRTLGLTRQGPEAREVVLADERLRRLLHGSQIQRAMGPERPPTLQCRACRPRQDEVSVVTCRRRETRVESHRHGHGPKHIDVVWQVGIAAEDPRPRRPPGSGIEMHDLLEGVHAGIRAPRAVDGDRTIGDPGQRLLETGLHGAQAAGLHLPTVKAGSVVLDA